MNLREIVSFGNVYYDYCYTDKKGEQKYENVEFPGVEDNKIWEILFDDTSIKFASGNEYRTYIMSISVDISFLGYKNIALAVSEEGYLHTNILETGKDFYIGEERANKFIKYIIENYDGYRTVYVDENGNEFTEESIEETRNDVIMMYENKTN